MSAQKPNLPSRKAADHLHMMDLIRFTARTLETASPVPFGALIVETATGKPFIRAVNAVRAENDPSSHAELRAVRQACHKLKSFSLKGYTLYTTCEPCPMCMADALWAGLDRVVYGATIADASKYCRQIHISARKVARRSDMDCTVDGPMLRKACNELFTHPDMIKAFATWNPKIKTPKLKSSKLKALKPKKTKPKNPQPSKLEATAPESSIPVPSLPTPPSPTQ